MATRKGPPPTATPTPTPMPPPSTPPPPVEAAAEWVDIDTLVPWEENPRKNDGRPVDEVAASIRRFGFATPITARRADRRVIAGHTRLKAARALGITRVPVRFLDIDPADADLLALADNKTNELAEWDAERLTAILGRYPDVEALGLGWTADELEFLVGGINADNDGLGNALGGLPGGEPEWHQMSLTFTTEILADVNRAIASARAQGDGHVTNNSEAIALICQEWLAGRGDAT